MAQRSRAFAITLATGILMVAVLIFVPGDLPNRGKVLLLAIVVFLSAGAWLMKLFAPNRRNLLNEQTRDSEPSLGNGEEPRDPRS